MQNNTVIEIYPKVWGEEHWIINKEYCGKKLVLKQGFRCSIHWHKLKDEVFYIASGCVLMEVNGASKIMFPGEKQYIAPGDKHRFTGILDSDIFEFSTTHIEEDSYRDIPSGSISQQELHSLIERMKTEPRRCS